MRRPSRISGRAAIPVPCCSRRNALMKSDQATAIRICAAATLVVVPISLAAFLCCALFAQLCRRVLSRRAVSAA